MPAINEKDFRCLFTAAEGYGTISLERSTDGLSVRIECVDGRVELESLALCPVGRKSPRAACRLNGHAVKAGEVLVEEGFILVDLARAVALGSGDRLTCRIRG